MFNFYKTLSDLAALRELYFFCYKVLNLKTLFKMTGTIFYIHLLSFNPLLSNPASIPIELKHTYADGNKITGKDSEQIMSILRKLVIAVEEKNASKIVKYISKEKGAYLDVKGLWDYESILEEIKKDDSYLEVYFFDHEKLVKQKQSENVLTVRELLQKSGGLEVDLFFESSTACEGKLRFKKNKKLEKDMNNPYFLKVKGKWYVYRLF
jgi:hypothetical protein